MAQMHEVSRRDFLRTGAVAASSVAVAGALGVQFAGADEAQGSEAPAQPTIYIIDRLVCKPGLGREVYDRYLERFEPFAAERGLTLDHAVIAPPVWLTDDVSSNTLEFIWSIEGYPAFAGALTYGSDEAAAWRADLETCTVSRDRSYFTTDADLEVLNA